MSFVKKSLISLPINGSWRLATGGAAPLIPTPLALATHMENANAPGVPFSPEQIGSFQYQPDGRWRQAQWSGNDWVPNAGVFASGDMVQLLNESRRRMLQEKAAKQSLIDNAVKDVLPFSGAIGSDVDLKNPALGVPDFCPRVNPTTKTPTLREGLLGPWE